MKQKLSPASNLPLEKRILTLRGGKVILDVDLAELYGVPTYRFNEAFKRNRRRFPDDFAFQLTAKEFANLRSQMTAANSSQIAMSSSQAVEREGFVPNWSQFATSSRLRRGAAYRPWAFTEHGAIMAASVLNSPQAVQMSVFVVRAFVKMRAALKDTRELAQKLTALEQELRGRLDFHEAAIVDVLQRIMRILDPPPAPPGPPKPQIGFHVKEDAVPYRVRKKSARL